MEFTVYKAYSGTQTSEIVLTCPTGQVLAGEESLQSLNEERVFVLGVGKEVLDKAAEQVEKVQRHVWEMNEKLVIGFGLEVEEAMEALVGSDWMADVVWKCRK